MTDTAGLYLRLGDSIDPAVNGRVHALVQAILADPLPGISDVVPSYASVYVEYHSGRLHEEALSHWLDGLTEASGQPSSRHVTVQVRYDGPDLEAVARHAGIAVSEVIRRHTARSYRVFAIGFTPGFPFMGEVDPLLRIPRLDSPRARVEAHAVAIADSQTGIYPQASPGGWRLLGSALQATYDPHRQAPFLLEPGDTVTFESADGTPPAPIHPLELLPEEPRHPLLKVVDAGLLDLVVDAGREMVGRFGLASSGPLDASSARLANRLLGNRPDSPVLELNGRGSSFKILNDLVMAFAGWGVRPTVDGNPVALNTTIAVGKGGLLSFPPRKEGARGYLALPGGIESNLFLGSASVDVRGLIGRPLRFGDVLGGQQLRPLRAGFSFDPYLRRPVVVGLRLIPGPQTSADSVWALTRGPFTVAGADRMGIRFEGEPVPGAGILSEANPLGALQVTAGGQPLLLLNDRGTIGGYSKAAIIHPADLPKAGQLKSGDEVRFLDMTGVGSAS